MPNGVYHAVWNSLPSVAVGDNPLYETSFDELIGSGELDGNTSTSIEIFNSDWIRPRIILKAKGTTKTWIADIEKQIISSTASHD